MNIRQLQPAAVAAFSDGLRALWFYLRVLVLGSLGWAAILKLLVEVDKRYRWFSALLDWLS